MQFNKFWCIAKSKIKSLTLDDLKKKKQEEVFELFQGYDFVPKNLNEQDSNDHIAHLHCQIKYLETELDAAKILVAKSVEDYDKMRLEQEYYRFGLTLFDFDNFHSDICFTFDFWSA